MRRRKKPPLINGKRRFRIEGADPYDYAGRIVPQPGRVHRDKTKYSRRKKHKEPLWRR
jgi:hypothetical protein